MPEPVGLREQTAAAIWAELHRQAEEETFGPCVMESDGIVDGCVNMSAVAAAVVEALGLTEERAERRTEQVNDGPIRELGAATRWVSGWSVVGDEQ